MILILKFERNNERINYKNIGFKERLLLIEFIEQDSNPFKFKDKAIIAGLNLSTAKSIKIKYLSTGRIGKKLQKIKGN